MVTGWHLAPAMLRCIQMESAVRTVSAFVPIELIESEDLRFNECAGDLMKEICLNDNPVLVNPSVGESA
jgi:hypothetical protein